MAVVLAIVSYTAFLGRNKALFAAAGFIVVAIIVGIPMLLESRMKKAAAALESGFQAQGFTYQYKFESNNAVYYIDQGGRMGVVFRGIPLSSSL